MHEFGNSDLISGIEIEIACYIQIKYFLDSNDTYAPTVS